MCELLGMGSLLPTRVSLSLGLLAQRGNASRRLADGWGAGFHDGTDALVVREPRDAASSSLIAPLRLSPPASRFVIAHIRHATQGDVSLRNTQPFQREIGGRAHVFAHNGNLQGARDRFGASLHRFRPIGTTDSEIAFCALLTALAPLWVDSVPTLEARLAVIAEMAEMLRGLGPANFLYTDGDALFAHADRRTQSDGSIAPPGLTMLHRSCSVDVDALPESGVDMQAAPGGQIVTLFASVPLTDEPWKPMATGDIVAVRDGAIADMVRA